MHSNYELNKAVYEFYHDYRDLFKYYNSRDIRFIEKYLKIMKNSRKYNYIENNYIAANVITLINNS